MKTIWQVCDITEGSENSDPVTVYAGTAEEAARMVVGSGPYDFAPEPGVGAVAPAVELSVEDEDGSLFECAVYGPF